MKIGQACDLPEGNWLGKKDSNLRMPESKSGALTNLATPQRVAGSANPANTQAPGAGHHGLWGVLPEPGEMLGDGRKSGAGDGFEIVVALAVVPVAGLIGGVSRFSSGAPKMPQWGR
jgi:hypothetical protein